MNQNDRAAEISSIREFYRQRQDLQRAATRLTLQVKALCRRACNGELKPAQALCKNIETRFKESDAIPQSDLEANVLLTALPLLQARAHIVEAAKLPEKELVTLVRRLPAFSFVKSTQGFGEIGLGTVIGICGDLSNYANPAKVWRRFGLAPGQNRPAIGLTGEERKKAYIAAGYSPQRRAAMYVLGDAMIKQTISPYRALYLERLKFEHAKALAEGLIPATIDKATVEKWRERDLPELTKVKKLGKEHRSAMHLHRRAQRYMEKRLLRDLWRAWRDAA